MTALEQKCHDYIACIAAHEKKDLITQTRALTAEEFKQHLYEYAASERALGEQVAAIVGSREYTPHYADDYLLPVLHRLRTGTDYYEAPVEILTKFAKTISGLPNYYDPEDPKPTDRFMAILVFRALLDNEMKRPEPTDIKIGLSRDLAMCLSHTVGMDSAPEAIKCIEQLFAHISPAQAAAIGTEYAYKMYPYCKFVWTANRINHPQGYGSLEAIFDDVNAFKRDAMPHLPEYDWAHFDKLIHSTRMVIGTNCEFGGGKHFTTAFAREQLDIVQQGLDPQARNAFAHDIPRITFLQNNDLDEKLGHDTTHLSWAELAYKCGELSRDEYLRFLRTLAQVIQARPFDVSYTSILLNRMQAGLSATAVLCKYEPDTPLALDCLDWLARFSAKGMGRTALGHLGDELNTVLNSALRGLPIREKALRMLRLTTETTYAHSLLCADMAVDLAQLLLRTRPDFFRVPFPNAPLAVILDEIYAGALLHDLGKMEISGPISQVIRTLFDEEFMQIKTHPTRALRYLTAQAFACARACAAWHHEHYDGKSGYPLNYTDPHAEPYRIVAQLVTYADCYTSALDRYKSAYQPEKKPADVLDELAILSRAPASERFNKPEGRILYHPQIADALAADEALTAKYADEARVKQWIEAAYYDAYVAFQG